MKIDGKKVLKLVLSNQAIVRELEHSKPKYKKPGEGVAVSRGFICMP